MEEKKHIWLLREMAFEVKWREWVGGRKKPHERVQMSKSLAVGKLLAHLDRVVAFDWKIG